MKIKNKRNKTSILIKITEKAFLIIAILMVFQISCSKKTFAQESKYDSTEAIEKARDELIRNQLQSSEIKALKEYLSEYATGAGGKLLDELNPDEIIKDAVKGDLKLNISKLTKKILSYFIQEIYLNLNILLKLITIIIICAVLNNLQNSFIKEGVGELAFFVCYIVIVSMLVIGFKEAASFGINVIEQMAGFMYATIPVMVTLLISSGSITSGGVFQPILIMAVETAATIIKNVFIPIVFLSTALSIINNVSEKLHLERLAGLIKKIGMAFLGIILTIFIGVVTIQGPVSAVADGVVNKTIKFAIGTFIPVVGGYLSDAADMVIGCSLLIKNAAGVLVMLGVISICLIPVLKMSVIISLYKITCALTEPISEKRITNCINDVANSITLILGAVAVVAFMFVISITVIIAAGNMTAMVR
ncbi:MAG TPA: stage III sporulation protein AE [Clostridiales bacterium]|nr:stage III sporulation protein AE [Clostridiales bacterium]